MERRPATGWRVAAAMLAGAVTLLAACGEERPLADVGDLSERFVHDETTTTAAVSTTVDPDGPGVGFVHSADVTWWNDDLGVPVFSTESALQAVIERNNGTNEFVQASREEIAWALPGVAFPALVPESVAWVTSQLVLDLDSGQLDGETSAAFGLWTLEPYVFTRGQGQAAVLTVGEVDLEQDSTLTSIRVDQGLTLVWQDRRYRYELFCRSTLPEDLCWAMAENLAPLEDQLL